MLILTASSQSTKGDTVPSSVATGSVQPTPVVDGIAFKTCFYTLIQTNFMFTVVFPEAVRISSVRSNAVKFLRGVLSDTSVALRFEDEIFRSMLSGDLQTSNRSRYLECVTRFANNLQVLTASFCYFVFLNDYRA